MDHFPIDPVITDPTLSWGATHKQATAPPEEAHSEAPVENVTMAFQFKRFVSDNKIIITIIIVVLIILIICYFKFSAPVTEFFAGKDDDPKKSVDKSPTKKENKLEAPKVDVSKIPRMTTDDEKKVESPSTNNGGGGPSHEELMKLYAARQKDNAAGQQQAPEEQKETENSAPAEETSWAAMNERLKKYDEDNETGEDVE